MILKLECLFCLDIYIYYFILFYIRRAILLTFEISTSAKTQNKINYSYCLFKCIHFEDPEKKLAKTKSVGKRPKQLYIKPTNCPAYFRLFRRTDGPLTTTQSSTKSNVFSTKSRLTNQSILLSLVFYCRDLFKLRRCLNTVRSLSSLLNLAIPIDQFSFQRYQTNNSMSIKC